MANKKTRRAPNEGTYYEEPKGSGKWRVRVIVKKDPATGKPVYRREWASSKEDAKQKVKRLQRDADSGKLIPTKATSLVDYLDHWLEHSIKATRAPKTHAVYSYLMTNHVIPTLGKEKIDKLRRPHVQQLVSALLTQPVRSRSKPKEDGDDQAEQDEPTKPTKFLSRRTVAAVVAVLHSAYEDAIRDGCAMTNPAAYVQLPAAAKKPPVFLKPAQVVALHANLGVSPIRELVLFMLVTGTRLGEARGLRRQDVDVAERVVRIAGQLQADGQGKLQYRPTTKTNQDRELAIPQWMADELRDLLSRTMLAGWEDPDGIVFLNPYGRRMGEKYVYNELHKACNLAKIPRISPHKLRHTAATLALIGGGDLHGVQKMLGHQQGRLTSDLYGHATAERLRPIADALGEIVRPTPKEQAG